MQWQIWTRPVAPASDEATRCTRSSMTVADVGGSTATIDSSCIAAEPIAAVPCNAPAGVPTPAIVTPTLYSGITSLAFRPPTSAWRTIPATCTEPLTTARFPTNCKTRIAYLVSARIVPAGQSRSARGGEMYWGARPCAAPHKRAPTAFSYGSAGCSEPRLSRGRRRRSVGPSGRWPRRSAPGVARARCCAGWLRGRRGRRTCRFRGCRFRTRVEVARRHLGFVP
jgi:hypothetical protein